MKDKERKVTLSHLLHYLVDYVESSRDLLEVKKHFIDGLYYSNVINFRENLLFNCFFNSLTWYNSDKNFIVNSTNEVLDDEYIISFIDSWE